MAVTGLDYTIPEDKEIIERLNRAVLIQFTVSAEAAMAEQQILQSAMPQQPGPAPEGMPEGVPGMSVGQAPESINPQTNPVGAAGGLPLGLSA